MRKNMTRALLAAFLLCVAPAAYADGPGDAGRDVAAPPVRAAPAPAPRAETAPTPQAEPAAAEGRTGVIPLNNNELTLNVPQGYRFYSAEEAYAYMQRNNAAAPSGTVLGMIAAANADIRAPGTWATIVSYDAIGYVQPETASGLSDANFETQVREARRTQNRTFEGFFAEPTFDSNAPHVIWAERTAAPGAGGKDLRHEQKSLGRYGVATLTSLGNADQMDEITAAASGLQAMLTFPEGRRHADFQPANDQVSSFSVPGLVTGVPTAEPQALAESASTGQTNIGGLAGWFPWIAFGAIAIAVAGYLFMRRRNDEDDLEEA